MDISWATIIFGAVANVGIIEWAKSFPKASKFKRYFNWLPLAGAVLAGLAVSSYAHGEFNVAAWAVQTIGILSVSVLGYKNIVEFVQKKLHEATTTEPSKEHLQD